MTCRRPASRCVHAVAAMMALFVTSSPAASAQGEPSAAIDSIMQQVLSGDVAAALTAAEGLRRQYPGSLVDNLAIELRDLERGGYATTNNRSFPELAPLWSAARARWLEAQPQPGGQLPGAIVALPDTVERVLLVDGSHSSAWLMQRDATGGWSGISGFYVSIGASGTDKRKRGDRRTPLGVYYAIDELDAARLPARYGSSVLTLDYPNALDIAQGRSGDGIWLHGIDPDNNVRPPRDTDGCIAFDNARIGTLREALALRRTPVIVADNFDWQRGAEPDEVGAQLRGMLQLWRETQLSSDAESLIGLHRDDYARHGLSPQLWRAGVRARLAAGLLTDIGVEELEILLADSDEGIYLTRFRQVLHRAGRAPVVTMRRLYWQRIADSWRIIAEQNG